MAKVFVIPFTHIDWPDMIARPSILDGVDEFTQTLPCTEEQARAAFLKAGWEGEGQLGVIWLPPFLFEYGDTAGECIWHVKQPTNGISWLLAPRPFDFPGFKRPKVEWKAIELNEPVQAT